MQRALPDSFPAVCQLAVAPSAFLFAVISVTNKVFLYKYHNTNRVDGSMS